MHGAGRFPNLPYSACQQQTFLPVLEAAAVARRLTSNRCEGRTTWIADAHRSDGKRGYSRRCKYAPAVSEWSQFDDRHVDALCVCFQVALLSLVEEVIGRLLLVFLAEFLEGWIRAQRVPKRIEPKKGRRNRR